MTAARLGLSANTVKTQLDYFSDRGIVRGVTMIHTDANGSALGTVSLQASSQSNVMGISKLDSVAVAYLDPRLSIESGWLADHPGATLTLRAGVGNEISPVSEPASGLLMLGGSLLIACAVQRRSTKGGSVTNPA